MKRWLTLAVALSACGPSAERVEADRVQVAIHRLRASNMEDVEGLRHQLEQLELEPATLWEAKLARDACARAYRLLLEVKELETRARGTGLEGSGDPAAVDLAQEKLSAAKLEMPNCDAASAKLTIALSP